MEYISPAMLRSLREERGMTQKQLAETLCVSDKTISKWETGRGLPDIAILPELAEALRVSVTELLTGEAVRNRNRSGNMKKTRFYVCPLCGNVIASVGEGSYSCCGIALPALEPEENDAEHRLMVSRVEDEILVEMAHPMERGHAISFAAYVTDDRLELVKLYPEQDMTVRFFRRGPGLLYAYCNRHGLRQVRV